MALHLHMSLCPTSGTLEWGKPDHPEASTLTCQHCGHSHPIIDL